MDFGSLSPGVILITVVGLALAPFVAVMVTSFTKIVVVLSLLRNALGLLGATVGREYLLRFIRREAPAPVVDQRVPALIEQARVAPEPATRIENYCALGRVLNQKATWFWTFQNTYYALTSAKVKGIPPLYSSVINVSRAWIE